MILPISQCVFIDVGHTTALAYWPTTSNINLVEHYYFKVHYEQADWIFDTIKIFSAFLREIKNHSGIAIIRIEGMEVYAENYKSRTAASRGDLSKIAYLAGIYAATALQFCPCVEIVSASVWKGQLSKDATQRWTEKIIPYISKHCNEHEIDAVAMGLSYTELWPFKRTKI